MQVYVGTSQGQLALIPEDDLKAVASSLSLSPDPSAAASAAAAPPPAPSASAFLGVPLGSSRRRELVARAPLVVAALTAITSLPDDAFQKHLGRFFPWFAELVSCEHGSAEIQVALSRMFSTRIGPLVFQVAQGG